MLKEETDLERTGDRSSTVRREASPRFAFQDEMPHYITTEKVMADPLIVNELRSVMHTCAPIHAITLKYGKTYKHQIQYTRIHTHQKKYKKYKYKRKIHSADTIKQQT